MSKNRQSQERFVDLLIKPCFYRLVGVVFFAAASHSLSVSAQESIDRIGRYE